MTRPKEFTALQMLKNLVENEEYQEDDDHTYDPGSSLDSSEYESFDEADDVSDSELKFLEAGIDELIREEDTKGKDHRRVVDFLQKVGLSKISCLSVLRVREGRLRAQIFWKLESVFLFRQFKHEGSDGVFSVEILKKCLDLLPVSS